MITADRAWGQHLVHLLGITAPPLLVLTAHVCVAPSRNSYGYYSAGLLDLNDQALRIDGALIPSKSTSWLTKALL